MQYASAYTYICTRIMSYPPVFVDFSYVSLSKYPIVCLYLVTHRLVVIYLFSVVPLYYEHIHVYSIIGRKVYLFIYFNYQSNI